MPNPFLGVRIPPELDEAIAARMHKTGQSKSDIVIEALKVYLRMPSCQERLAAIEQRLADLEEIAAEAMRLRAAESSGQQHHHHHHHHTQDPI